MSRRNLLKTGAACIVLALVAAACSSTTDQGQQEEEGTRGGQVVLGAEQWPECLNPITQCANASWLHWTVLGHVLPRAMELDKDANHVASPVLVEAPTVDNGGIQTDPFRISFKIRPEAKWDDGSDITSADFEFTWQAYIKTTGTISTVGYDKITGVDVSDPKTAVVSFSEPFAAWSDLFGGASNYLLKKAAFKGTDVKDDMTSAIPFSGAPWKLQTWTKEQAILVRNDAYWDKDRVTMLDQVTMVPRTDQDTEINALLSGEVAAIYPQPAPAITKRFEAPGVSFKVAGGTTYEGLWFNQGTDTLDSAFANAKVREAFVHAVDRQEVVDTIIKPDFPNAEVLNCAGWVPTVGQWCDNTDFADISYNPDKAKEILQGDGWTLGSDGIFAKGGKRLSIEWNTTAGNKGRNDTQLLVKEQAKKAGIELVIKNFEPGFLFEKKLPKRDFQLAEFANVASPDPTITTLYACDQIPTKANDFSGQNWMAWCNEEATRVAKASDAEVDPAKRLELIRKLGDLVRQDLVWLPLYQKPLVLAWRSDQLGGPVDAFAASTYSGFANMYDWFKK